MQKRSRDTNGDTVKPTVALDDQQDPGYTVELSMISDVGCVRDINEDSCRYTRPADEPVARKGLLMLVADGMGGHSAGEVASQTAVETITRSYYDNQGPTRDALEAAFHDANRAINELSQRDEKLVGMGTTCTAFVLQNGSALAAHVGDSRLYMIRNGQIYVMTEDHSAVMEMVKRGWISLEEARHHPEKNVILRALGSHPEVEVTIWESPLPVRAGDRFVICSDGLYDLVEDEEIRQIALASAPGAACDNLIDLAKRRGGHDNITVGIVSLVDSSVTSDHVAPETRQAEVIE